MTDIRYYATLEEVEQADEAQEGICRACGEHSSGVEPDAEGYKCENCGEPRVYGAGEFLLRGWVE
jgi:tRNA(Ile2) C34 agmatinyltransferase TiaS